MIKLTDTLKADILAHAQDEDPRECCGLIHVVKGRRRYYPCRNIAATPDEHFILDPADYAAAEDLGEVVAVVHSHPVTQPIPSAADQIGCNNSGLPWVIVNPKTETWGGCEPAAFELPYVGREFVFGVVDCYSLVRDWYSREWGLTLADFDRRDRFWERGENLYLDSYRSQGFRQVPFEELQYGDAILMQLSASLPNHAAIYLGDQQILHHVQGRLSSRDVYGGYYVKSTALVLRHESR
jgi:proteasome lid subunit RPN8/RPN11